MSFGMIFWDNNGSHIYSRTLAMPGVYAPEKGETICLFEALSWIKELDVRNVLVEMDAKVVVNAFNSQDAAFISIFGDIIQPRKNIFRCFPYCKIGWINRQANELAHNLARVSTNFPSPYVWVELPYVECHPFTDLLVLA
ncbi:hypothetical protein ACS0TY_030809 [Phlomoides rotata]